MLITTMSDYEDDFDDDLPSVSLSQTCEKSEFEMPSAAEVASQRAREEAAERALKDLREADVVPRYVSLSRSASQGSSSEEGEVNSFFMANEDTDLLAALSAAVSALQVTEARPEIRNTCQERLEMMVAMRDYLPSDDVEFLDAYIRVLRDRREAVDAVTEKILQTISSALITKWGAAGVSGVCVWLLCVSLTSTKGLRARRALHALLDTHATSEDVGVVTRACTTLQDGAEQLLAAADALRSGARRGADALADGLLARAVAKVLPTDQQETKSLDTQPPAPLSAENITSIRVSWRKMCPRAQLTLLRCAGRALAARGEKGEEETGEGEEREEGGTALLDALAQPLPRASVFHEDRQQVLTNLSKLQLLFRSRFSPEPEDDILDTSQGSISELTDTPTDIPMTGETMTLTRESTRTEETIMTEETSLTRNSTLSGETIMTEGTSMTRGSTLSRYTPMSSGTSMSMDIDMNSQSTSEFTETPETISSTDKMTAETNNKYDTPKKEQIETAKEDTPKKKTQTKLDRYMKREPPTKTGKKHETDNKIETTKETEKKRETKKETDKRRDAKKESERKRDTKNESEKKRDTKKETEKGKDSKKETEREIETKKASERKRDTKKESEKKRDTKKETEKRRDAKKETEREMETKKESEKKRDTNKETEKKTETRREAVKKMETKEETEDYARSPERKRSRRERHERREEHERLCNSDKGLSINYVIKFR